MEGHPMRPSARGERRLRELIDTDLPPGELERLAYVDTLLRVVAAGDRDDAARLAPHADRDVRTTEEPRRPGLRLVADHEACELSLTWAQLVLVHKSLQAVKRLGHPRPQDELLEDTIHVVDLAMAKARARESPR